MEYHSTNKRGKRAKLIFYPGSGVAGESTMRLSLLTALFALVVLSSIYFDLPQLTETNTPRSTDVAGERLFYNERMKRVFLGDERSDQRQLLVDINMQVVGEVAGWPSASNCGPTTHPDIVVEIGVSPRTDL
jgi:hypothetical protein